MEAMANAHDFEQQLSRGDLRAAAEWLVEHGARDVACLCRRMLRDVDAADDLAQVAFERAFAALPRFRGEASPLTWLHSIARNACLDHLRRERIRPWELRADPGEEASAHDGDAEPDAWDVLVARRDAQRALRALDEAERALVVLRFVDGLDYDELSSMFGATPGALRMRIARLRERMSDALAPEIEAQQAPMLGEPVSAPLRDFAYRGAPLPREAPPAPLPLAHAIAELGPEPRAILAQRLRAAIPFAAAPRR